MSKTLQCHRSSPGKNAGHWSLHLKRHVNRQHDPHSSSVPDVLSIQTPSFPPCSGLLRWFEGMQ